MELGEERVINHSGVGISLSEPLDIDKITRGIDASDKQAVAKALTETTWDEVNKEYAKIDEAITTSAQKTMESQGYVLV